MPATIINLFGGPATGKTTVALGLTYFMKRAGLRVKYVQEYAEDMVYEKRSNILADQLYILAKQNRRMLTKIDSNDFIVTDSPLLLGLVYAVDMTPEFESIVWQHWNVYRNVSFYIQRDETFDFQLQGRSQTSHEECRAIDRKIQQVVPPDTTRVARGEDYVTQVIRYLRLGIDLTAPTPLVA